MLTGHRHFLMFAPASRRLTIRVLIVMIGLTVMATISSCTTRSNAITGMTASQATAQAEQFLIETHRADVQSVIENYQTRWLSLDAHKDPSIQAQLATGPYLESWGYARMGKTINDEPFWLITKSAVAKSLHILEYGPERFVAVARVIKLNDKIKPSGEFIESMPAYESCGVYVFIREEAVWKLATYFDMSVPQDIDRDWRDAPAWSKQLIGDLPRNMCDE